MCLDAAADGVDALEAHPGREREVGRDRDPARSGQLGDRRGPEGSVEVPMKVGQQAALWAPL
jgi:hypothetical protein